MKKYSFDNSWERAGERLALLEESLDPVSQRRLQSLGVERGWHCLELGGGGGSIARWLSAQVGASGRVLATDLDTRFLEPLAGGNLEVRRHDLLREDLPIEAFDLIHTRLLLMHLPARNKILPRLLAALKPGGRVLLEEHDAFPVLALASGPYREVWDALLAVIRAAGTQSFWARDLPSLLQQAGFTNVTAEVQSPLFPGGSSYARFWSVTWSQVRDRMLHTGLSAEVLDSVSAELTDPSHWFTGPAMVAVVGQRPSL